MWVSLTLTNYIFVRAVTSLGNPVCYTVCTRDVCCIMHIEKQKLLRSQGIFCSLFLMFLQISSSSEQKHPHSMFFVKQNICNVIKHALLAPFCNSVEPNTNQHLTLHPFLDFFFNTIFHQTLGLGVKSYIPKPYSTNCLYSCPQNQGPLYHCNICSKNRFDLHYNLFSCKIF